MNNKAHRIVYYDILRIISTLAVITIHISGIEYYQSFGQYTWWAAATLDCLSHWAVPIFVMISGALFLDLNRKVSCRDLFRKNIPHLLFLYVFWWVAFFFINVALGFCPFTRAAFLKPAIHLWFLPMLIGLYLIVPFLRQLVRNKHYIY